MGYRSLSDFRRHALALLAFASLAPYSDSVLAQTAPEHAARNTVPANEKPIEFQLATDILPRGSVTLANGVVVNPSDWQALIMATILRDGQTATCTGTLLGPSTVLLAAHCVDNPLGTTARKSLLYTEGRQVEMSCDIYPDYLNLDYKFRSPRGSDDYALCKLKFNGVVPVSISRLTFEVVDANDAAPVNTQVLMTGFGCSELRIVDGALDWDASDHLLRIGDATITSAAGSDPSNPNYLSINSPKLQTPAVCPGDSGGPLFRNASTAKIDSKRRVIGVNSSVTLTQRTDGGYDVISYIAATGNKQFYEWAQKWSSSDKGATGIVCGVNRQAGSHPCHD